MISFFLKKETKTFSHDATHLFLYDLIKEQSPLKRAL